MLQYVPEFLDRCNDSKIFYHRGKTGILMLLEHLRMEFAEETLLDLK
jgi:hypothetical protein